MFEKFRKVFSGKNLREFSSNPLVPFWKMLTQTFRRAVKLSLFNEREKCERLTACMFDDYKNIR